MASLQTHLDISLIDAVLLSHYHHDHVADIGVLQYARLVEFYVTGKSDSLPIYGHTDDEIGFASLTSEYTKGIAYEPNQTLVIGPLSITFLKTKHPVSCYGMRITDGHKVFVYTADTAYQESWIGFSENADMIITDCNFYADQDGASAGHMSSIEGALIARKAHVNELVLSHLPQFGNNKQLVQEASQYFSGKVHLARTSFIWQ